MIEGQLRCHTWYFFRFLLYQGWSPSRFYSWSFTVLSVYNDVVQNIVATIKLFADDTSLYIIVDTPEHAAHTLNSDLNSIHEWADRWLVKFNPSKTESLLLSRRINTPQHPPLRMENTIIQEVQQHKHLGLILSSNGTWHPQIDFVKDRAWTRINIMRKLKFRLNRKTLEILYRSFIRPLLEYADVVWDNCTHYEQQDLERLQLEAARIVTGATKRVSFESLYRETGCESLKARRRKRKLILFYKMNNNLSPSYLTSLVPTNVGDTVEYNLRNALNTRTIQCRTQLYQNSFLPPTVQEWNNLSPDIRNSSSLNIFKNHLKADVTPVPTYYYTGQRAAHILHTRIRTNCSSLNHHLYTNNIIDSPSCICGAVETTHHFLLRCPLYTVFRDHMNTILTQMNVETNNASLLLYGDTSASDETNTSIFHVVQDYIIHTKRFQRH